MMTHFIYPAELRAFPGVGYPLGGLYPRPFWYGGYGIPHYGHPWHHHFHGYPYFPY
ncbi:hypothetical protein PU629_21515 [Pullulanibacillus sp. KACC 23026]|uniref:hypothetical protein n=1 Tax=Pullulanibacillus sp. KACC 23026 TaxID=3028315 RepID=UPI0023B08ED5|nr:hypothetical protein [Pullulanibacillus sp. KACC 23026]WEG12625.1 hypothetical protein PU629_21515 [Pullulanibacillus sp. KACC 23026]